MTGNEPSAGQQPQNQPQQPQNQPPSPPGPRMLLFLDGPELDWLRAGWVVHSVCPTVTEGEAVQACRQGWGVLELRLRDDLLVAAAQALSTAGFRVALRPLSERVPRVAVRHPGRVSFRPTGFEADGHFVPWSRVCRLVLQRVTPESGLGALGANEGEELGERALGAVATLGAAGGAQGPSTSLRLGTARHMREKLDAASAESHAAILDRDAELWLEALCLDPVERVRLRPATVSGLGSSGVGEVSTRESFRRMVAVLRSHLPNAPTYGALDAWVKPGASDELLGPVREERDLHRLVSFLLTRDRVVADLRAVLPAMPAQALASAAREAERPGCPDCHAPLDPGTRCPSCGALVVVGGHRLSALLESGPVFRVWRAIDPHGRQRRLYEWRGGTEASPPSAAAAREVVARAAGLADPMLPTALEVLEGLDVPEAPAAPASENAQGPRARGPMFAELPMVEGPTLGEAAEGRGTGSTRAAEVGRQVLELLQRLQAKGVVVDLSDSPESLAQRLREVPGQGLRLEGLLPWLCVPRAPKHEPKAEGAPSALAPVGILVLQLLTGRPLPPERDTWLSWGRHQLALDRGTPELRLWVSRLLADEDAEAYSSVEEALAALEATKGLALHRDTRPAFERRWRVRGRTLGLTAALVVVALGVPWLVRQLRATSRATSMREQRARLARAEAALTGKAQACAGLEEAVPSGRSPLSLDELGCLLEAARNGAPGPACERIRNAPLRAGDRAAQSDRALAQRLCDQMARGEPICPGVPPVRDGTWALRCLRSMATSPAK